jgi:hypothetical protein
VSNFESSPKMANLGQIPEEFKRGIN